MRSRALIVPAFAAALLIGGSAYALDVGIGGGALEARRVAAARGEVLAAHRAAALRAVARLGVVAIAEREQTALSHAGHLSFS